MDLLPRIEIDGASKTIGNSVVLDQIQLTVKPGEMIGLQGVNGSGKTMLLRLISGLIYPTKGHVLIDGKMLGSDLEFPPSIGFLIENPTFLPQYTGAENLQMLSSLHQMMPTAQIESVLLVKGVCSRWSIEYVEKAVYQNAAANRFFQNRSDSALGSVPTSHHFADSCQ